MNKLSILGTIKSLRSRMYTRLSHSKATEALSTMVQEQISLWPKRQGHNILLLVPEYKTCRGLIFIRCREIRMDTKDDSKPPELRATRLKLSAPGAERKIPLLEEIKKGSMSTFTSPP